MVSVWMYKMYTHFQYLYYSSTYAYLCRYVCPTLKAIDTSSLRQSRLKKRDPYSPCKIRDLFPAAIYPSSITIPQSPVTIYMSIFYDIGRYQVSRYLYIIPKSTHISPPKTPTSSGPIPEKCRPLLLGFCLPIYMEIDRTHFFNVEELTPPSF